jgi:DNA-binding beta-propeller fold protein YncE
MALTRGRAQKRAVPLSLAGLLVLATAALGSAGGGALTQPAGKAGCISEDGAGPCADGHGLAGGVDAVAASADGRNVYATTHTGVARFRRRSTTGAIVEPPGRAGCVSEDGSGPCANGHGLSGAGAVAVSRDGKSVYVATANGIVRFKRKHDGAVREPAGTTACVSEDGSGPCVDGRALAGAYGVAVSRDGSSVYVASLTSAAVARFKRDP